MLAGENHKVDRSLIEMLQLKKAIKLECLRMPLKQGLVVASEIGADAVEINARSELKPGELTRTGVRHLRKILADLNLKVAAIHFPTRRGYDDPGNLERRVEATKTAMAMAFDLGCQVVTNRIGQIPEDVGDERWLTMVQVLTDLGNASQKAGAWLAAQTGFDQPETMKGLLDALPTMAIGIDFDPAQMIMNRLDAVGGMKFLAEHVLHFRAADAVLDLSLGRGLEVDLGRGSVDLPALLGMLEEQNYTGYFTVQRDAEAEPVLHCANAIEYLTRLFE